MRYQAAIFVAFLSALLSVPAVAAPICLRQQDIASTNSPDGMTLVVKMRDGKVWVNQLQTQCPGLRFDGFSWVLHQPALICENAQSLRVLDSGEVCGLGKFTLQSHS